MEFLLKNKNQTEQDEIEIRENLNRLLLENVLPAHVATLFVGESKKNEVRLLPKAMLGKRNKVGGLAWSMMTDHPISLHCFTSMTQIQFSSGKWCGECVQC